MCYHERKKKKHAHIILLKYHAPLIEYVPISRIYDDVLVMSKNIAHLKMNWDQIFNFDM
jgi:hypothetical protein